MRTPENIIGELDQLHDAYGVTAFRFVDDLFLGVGRVIDEQMDAFTRDRIGERYVWDATGRINVLDRLGDRDLDRLVRNGLREVALGIGCAGRWVPLPTVPRARPGRVILLPACRTARFTKARG